MRLLTVELNRFRSRRAIVLLAVAAIAVAAVLVGKAAWDTRPLSHADRADAVAQAQLASNGPDLQQEMSACRAAPRDYLGPSATASDCAAALVPAPDSYYPRHTLSLQSMTSSGGLALPLALLVAGLMIIAGATFAGADWTTGSMTNQLLFEPRRTRVWLAKTLAVTFGCGGVALVALACFWVGVGAVIEVRGGHLATSAMTQVGGQALRAVALAAAAGAGAFALTMLLRHTVATLALLFVYAIGGEIVVNLLPVEGASRFAIGNNALGWLSRHYVYFDPGSGCGPGDRCSATHLLTHVQASAFLGSLLALALLASLMWFKRRDV